MSYTGTFNNTYPLDGSHMTASTVRTTGDIPSSWNGRTNGQSKHPATSQQVAGSHYKDLAIQPVEYIEANGIGFSEGCIIKYVTRWRKKGGVEDLKKARHFLDMMIERESAVG